VSSYWGDSYAAGRAERVLVQGDPPPAHERRQVASPLTDEMLRPFTSPSGTVQFSSLPNEGDLRRLGEWLSDQPTVGLRAYGSYDGSIVDLEFLQHFPNVRRFTADALWKLGSLDGLRHLPEDLESLTVGRTKRQLSLDGLDRFRQLTTLYLEGQTKGIQVLRDMPSLEDLTLRSITLPDLSLLTTLDNLWSLDLKLGGTKNLQLLPQVGRLRYLEIWMVKGFTDLSSVSDLPSLEVLFLQALKNVDTLPDLSRSGQLRHVTLDTMKGLRDLTPLTTAPALASVAAVAMQHLQPEDLTCLRSISTLRQVRLGLGQRKNDAAREAIGSAASARWDEQLAQPTRPPLSRERAGPPD
jgi:hypothetical protein